MKLRLQFVLVVLLAFVFSAGSSYAKTGIKIGSSNGGTQVRGGYYAFQGFTLTSGTPIPNLTTEMTYCGASLIDNDGVSHTLSFSEINLLSNFPVVFGNIYGGVGGIYSHLPQQSTNLANFNLQGIVGIEARFGGFAQLRYAVAQSEAVKNWIGNYMIDVGYRL